VIVGFDIKKSAVKLAVMAAGATRETHYQDRGAGS